MFDSIFIFCIILTFVIILLILVVVQRRKIQKLKKGNDELIRNCKLYGVMVEDYEKALKKYKECDNVKLNN